MGLMPLQRSLNSGINCCGFEGLLDPSLVPFAAGAGALCVRMDRPAGPRRRWPGHPEPERRPGPGGGDPNGPLVDPHDCGGL